MRRTFYRVSYQASYKEWMHICVLLANKQEERLRNTIHRGIAKQYAEKVHREQTKWNRLPSIPDDDELFGLRFAEGSVNKMEAIRLALANVEYYQKEGRS